MRENKEYLKKLDEFLASMDVEELIRDGINLIRFRYQKGGIEIIKSYTITELKKEQKKCKQ